MKLYDTGDLSQNYVEGDGVVGSRDETRLAELIIVEGSGGYRGSIIPFCLLLHMCL